MSISLIANLLRRSDLSEPVRNELEAEYGRLATNGRASYPTVNAKTQGSNSDESGPSGWDAAVVSGGHDDQPAHGKSNDDDTYGPGQDRNDEEWSIKSQEEARQKLGLSGATDPSGNESAVKGFKGAHNQMTENQLLSMMSPAGREAYLEQKAVYNQQKKQVVHNLLGPMPNGRDRNELGSWYFQQPMNRLRQMLATKQVQNTGYPLPNFPYGQPPVSLPVNNWSPQQQEPNYLGAAAPGGPQLVENAGQDDVLPLPTTQMLRNEETESQEGEDQYGEQKPARNRRRA